MKETVKKNRSLKTEHRQAKEKNVKRINKIDRKKQNIKFMESLILAQDERWRRA